VLADLFINSLTVYIEKKRKVERTERLIHHMKGSILILLIWINNFGLMAQNIHQRDYTGKSPYDSIRLSEVYYLNVSLKPFKNDLLLKLGAPDSIVNPAYDCGGFSEYWQEEVFHQFFYKSLIFIGSELEFVIESIDFLRDKSITLDYKGHKLSYQTELNDFREVFPQSFDSKVIDNNNNQIFIYLLPKDNTDDLIIVVFENGHLKELKYWAPC
jgi:hypothetical protein